MRFDIKIAREVDGGRFIAEVPSLPRVLAYGASAEEAGRRAAALVLRALAEQIEHGEHGKQEPIEITIGLAAQP
jgi:predicted RNase H-like HicB family nuclease